MISRCRRVMHDGNGRMMVLKDDGKIYVRNGVEDFPVLTLDGSG